MKTGSQSLTVLVTGANRGIGFATARELALRGHRVLMTSRDTAAGEAALDRIHKTPLRRSRLARPSCPIAVSSKLHAPATRGAEVDISFLDPGLNSRYHPERAYKNAKLTQLKIEADWATLSLESAGGRYFDGRHETLPSADAWDTLKAELFWRLASGWLGPSSAGL